jgi:hypothetical protein
MNRSRVEHDIPSPESHAQSGEAEPARPPTGCCCCSSQRPNLDDAVLSTGHGIPVHIPQTLCRLGVAVDTQRRVLQSSPIEDLQTVEQRQKMCK